VGKYGGGAGHCTGAALFLRSTWEKPRRAAGKFVEKIIFTATEQLARLLRIIGLYDCHKINGSKN